MSMDTRQSLINSAEFMLRSRGYAAFSYADLEKMVGIRKASIHHYFPKKEDLGVEIVETYINRSAVDFEKIDHDFPNAFGRLCAFAALFRAAMADGMLPLCGALAAEMAALPETMQSLTRKYFTLQLQWLEKTIEEGTAAGEFAATGTPRQKAFQILSLLEGSSFVRWAMNDGTDLEPAAIGAIVFH
ncbi:TPA: TetR/AcrR family transcriptional regulator [Klebsiella pneumoniae]|uniref:TetR family transcriptional regulator n=3 Tax=Enterobacteriaceae TaxID=543 RepID=A0ABX9FVZ1_9ENTR|nr:MULTISPECIES: TetR/AcrR family transcriptional regulator [Enterobacteriaceae]EIM33942.1 TetR family transcriptional regulator [Enterobacter cloacae subsp. cloacae GS1]RBP10862.1 TetR family transcriptional regulator [Pseudocitrobacter faecalis]HBM2839918.1 TetR/AcrR family transcriptional regulator [Enterobacter hormaechei subsp. xiangfangensis]HBR1164146.1 TetR/AcrR family transcriptional regulator [Klebsiella quasipneumoniae subsp. similipneumoniae]HDC4292970.1 TetR/AcrR family transcript